MQPGHNQGEHGLLQRGRIGDQSQEFAFLKLLAHHRDDFIEFFHAPSNRGDVLVIHNAFGLGDGIRDIFFQAFDS